MSQDVAAIEREFEEALASAGNGLREVDAVRVAFLGKKGRITTLLAGIRDLTDVRPTTGSPAAVDL